jgi:predicted  nucleic acid-binding Zn-ribbon protein
MREVERLYQLQELDEGIALYERKMQEWAGRLQQTHRHLAEARRAHQEGEKDLQALQPRLRQAEGALWEHESRLKGLEQRLYSDTIRSEREAAAIQAEIEQVRQQKDSLESEALQLMMEMDEGRTRLDKLIWEEERCLHEYDALVEETRTQEKALQEQVEPLRSARASLVAQVPREILAVYEQVQRTGGKPVVRLVDNSCSGCRVDVPLLRRKALAAGKLVRCENCGRILLG